MFWGTLILRMFILITKKMIFGVTHSEAFFKVIVFRYTLMLQMYVWITIMNTFWC